MKDLDTRRSGNPNKRPNDHRDPFQRDRARILHSSAFRRLQAKTQILGVGHDDFYRTRLTHSLEVSQIGTGLTEQLRQSKAVIDDPELSALIPNDSLIESLCLAHDIGHPPFGHGGETALNFKMFKAGGFEANGHALRIVSKLEPYTQSYGMDLTRRTLLGLIKYPQFIRSNTNFADSVDDKYISMTQWKPIKGLFGTELDVFNWILEDVSETEAKLFASTTEIKSTLNSAYMSTKSLYKSFDASIMEMADDIAYAVHDLEDAIALNIVNRDMWNTDVLPGFKSTDNPWAIKHSEQLSNMLFSDEHHQRKNAIGALVNHLITNVETFQTNLQFKEPLFLHNIRLNEASNPILKLLKDFVYRRVIMSTEIQQVEFKGQKILLDLFDAILSDPIRLVPVELKTRVQQATSTTAVKRVVCDYLANMSDSQALRVYNRLFGTTM